MSQKKVSRIAWWVLTLTLAVPSQAAPPAEPAPPEPLQPRTFTPEEEGEARALLGERFTEFAPDPIRAGIPPRMLRQGETLFEAAMRMSPKDPRYPRKLAETCQALGEVTGEIAAWTAYRRIVPTDQVAQNRVIDLYFSRIETADGKLAYLKDLLSKPSIPDEVKAYVAARAAVLLDQRSHSDARAMLEQAAKYYPLPEVTYLQWRALPADAAPAQRFAAIIARLRSNPVQADAIAAGADILANAGLTDQALNWYVTLNELHARTRTAPVDMTFVNYYVELYRAGETASAAEKLDVFLRTMPEISNAAIQGWFLRLTMQRGDESSQTLSKVHDLLMKRLNVVAAEVLKQSADTQPAPTTEPGLVTPPSPATKPGPTGAADAPATTQADTVDAGPVSLEAAVARAKTVDPQLKDFLALALGDMAWFELYFDKSPGLAPPLIDNLKNLLPAGNLLVVRLQGWYDLQSGHTEEARKAFTAAQDKDPLCALGLFRLEEQEKHAPQAEEIGRKILANPRGGTLGAILWQALKGRGLKPSTQPAESGVIAKELDALPPVFLTAVHSPQHFYVLRAEPLRNGRRLGEPLYAVVTVGNIGKQDLTVGENGLIKPSLWFDAQIRGVAQQTFPAVTFDRLMGTSVLHPGQMIQQVVRLDEGDLGEVLRERPLVTLFVMGGVVTNPLPTQKDVLPSAGGYSVSFTKAFTRTPTMLTSESARRKFFGELRNGTPGAKLLDLEALAAYVRQYAGPTATPQEKAVAGQYFQIIEQEQSDPAPGVKTWASYLVAALEGPGAAKTIDEMLASDLWESRLMGLIVARHLPADAQKDLMARAALKDADVTVKAYAAATLDLLQNPTTQPAATQPAATQPSATEPATTQPASTNPVGPLTVIPAAPEQTK